MWVHNTCHCADLCNEYDLHGFNHMVLCLFSGFSQRYLNFDDPGENHNLSTLAFSAYKTNVGCHEFHLQQFFFSFFPQVESMIFGKEKPNPVQVEKAKSILIVLSIPTVTA